MAVHIKQTPKTRADSTTQPISPTNYPLFSTWINTTYNIYTDYRYKVELIDEIGTQNTYSIVAQTPDLFGALSVSDFVNNTLDNIYQPKVNTITTSPNQIKNYQIKVTPFNNKSFQPGDSSESQTFFLMKASYEKIMWGLYSDELLVNHTKKTLTSNAYATNKALFGQFSRINPLFSVNFNKVKYKLTKKNGTIINFYINNTHTYHSMATESSLRNTDNSMLEIPIGPANIRDSFDTIVEDITLTNGFIYIVNGVIPIDIEDGDEYTYATYLDDTRMSNEYEIEIIDCKTRFEPMTLNFLNENGAYDTFTFYSKSQETIQNKQAVYLKSPYKRDGDHYKKESEYERGRTVYQDDIVESWIMDTDWLSNLEVQELKELWTSPDVYLQLNGVLTPVIIKEINAPIYNTKNRKLSKYQVTCIISNKKYRV